MARETEPYEWLKTPSDLCDEVIRIACNINEKITISHENLRKLLEHSYIVSQKPEEGRLPRFALFCASEENQRPSLTARRVAFDIPLDNGTLHRLAPTIPERPFSLLVDEVDGSLRAKGIYRFEFAVPFPGNQARSKGLAIIVDAPGTLRVGVGPFEVNLCEGQVIRTENFNKWIHESQSGFLEAVCPMSDEEADQDNLLRSLIAGPYQRVWHFMAAVVRASQHGGTFVVIPASSTDHLPSCLKIKHETYGPNLGEILVSYTELVKNKELSSHERVRSLQLIGERMKESVYATAKLAAADGCVVLSRGMNVLGFGAAIAFETGDLPPEIRQRGMRHRSSYHLCSQVESSMAVVVSQDGGIKVFLGRAGGKVAWNDSVDLGLHWEYVPGIL